MTKGRKVEMLEILQTALNEPGFIDEAFNQFYNYSFGNIMGVMIQTRIRGTHTQPFLSKSRWKKIGRSVREEEKRLAYWIWVATVKKYPIKEKDKKTGEEKIIGYSKYIKGFRYLPVVYLLEQTEGKEYKIPDHPEFDFEKAVNAFEIEISDYDHWDGNTGGQAAPEEKKLIINPLFNRQLQIGIHELAHCILHHRNDKKETWQREVEAEGVAYIVGHILKLDGAEESRGYLQHWLGSNSITDDMAQTIFSTANSILKAGTK